VSLSFVWLYEQNVPVVFLYSGLDGLTSLSDVHMATLIGDTVRTWCLQPQVFLHRMEEVGDLPWWQASTLAVVFGHHSAEAAVCCLDI
jgi:hypothetical protein